MKKTFIVISLLALAGIARTQVVTPSNENSRELGQTVYGLGLKAGCAGGFGISFRHHFPSPYSYQLVGGIIKVNTKLRYDIALELQYDLVRGDGSRFFACAASGYFYSSESVTPNELDGPMRVGLGIGGEWLRVQPFHLTAELMFTYFSDGTVLPLPEVGAHYYFF